jgi:hypothetical protein
VLRLTHCNGINISPNAEEQANRHVLLILAWFRRPLSLLVVVFEDLDQIGLSCLG